MVGVLVANQVCWSKVVSDRTGLNDGDAVGALLDVQRLALQGHVRTARCELPIDFEWAEVKPFSLSRRINRRLSLSIRNLALSLSGRAVTVVGRFGNPSRHHLSGGREQTVSLVPGHPGQVRHASDVSVHVVLIMGAVRTANRITRKAGCAKPIAGFRRVYV